MTHFLHHLFVVIGMVATAGYAAMIAAFYAAYRDSYPEQGRGLAMLAGLRWPLTVLRATRIYRED